MTHAQTRLLALLDAHVPLDAAEAAHLAAIHAFVASEPQCFSRATLPGHITGSAFVVDERRGLVLLHHHRKLDRWLQLGGHDDGACDAAATALREAREESGLTSLTLVPSILDVDVHDIPAWGTEPGHQHLDVRFLVHGDGGELPVQSGESHALQWFPVTELTARMGEPGAARVARRLMVR